MKLNLSENEISEIPLEIGTYALASSLSLFSSLSLSFSNTFLASLFASLSRTDHLVVVGAESYDELQHFANIITIVCDEDFAQS